MTGIGSAPGTLTRRAAAATPGSSSGAGPRVGAQGQASPAEAGEVDVGSAFPISHERNLAGLYLHQQSVLDRPIDRHGFARRSDGYIHPMRLFDDQGPAAVRLDDIAVHLTGKVNIDHSAGKRVGLR